MYNFTSLESVKKRAEKLDDQRDDKYQLAFNEALEYLEKFKKSPDFDITLLKKAAEKLIKTLEQKRSKAEPYICLSCIFYMTGDDRRALKYFKIANEISPDLPQVKQLQDLLGNHSIMEMSDSAGIRSLSRMSQQIEKDSQITGQNSQEQKIVNNSSNGLKRASPIIKKASSLKKN